MGSIIAMLVGKRLFGMGNPLTEAGARRVAHVGLFLVIAGMIALAVSCIRGDAVEDHQAKVERRARPATDKAADERAQDAIRNDKQAEDRRHVIEAQPDQPISPTSRALACQRLQSAGINSAACPGSARGR